MFFKLLKCNYVKKINMTTRELPERLKGQSSREKKDWHNEMMAKFNKLNEEYSKRAEGEFSKQNADVNNDLLNFDQDNVFNMITRAKQDIKTIKENNNELNKKLSQFNECKKDCRTLIESIEKLSDTYYKLSTNSQLFDIVNKLPIKQHLLDFEIISNITDFENDINLKIDEINQQIYNNNKKISNFKKLVLNCMDDEKEKDKNMCNICVARKINTCLNPCGHTFCLICVDKMNNKCGMCRASFISKIKMYIANDEISDSEDEGVNNNTVSDFDGFDGFALPTFENLPMPSISFPTSFLH